MWPFGCRGHDFGDYTPSVADINGIADSAIKFEKGYLLSPPDKDSVIFSSTSTYCTDMNLRAKEAYQVRIRHIASCQHDGCHATDMEFRPVGHVTRDSLTEIFETPEELGERVWGDNV